MPDTVLILEGVQTFIERHHILQGVSLKVPAGQALVLLGRNGAGKSTTLRTVMGLTPASQGSIVFDGAEITQARPYEIARAGIGFVPEDQAVLYTLTVEENFRLAMLSEDEASFARQEVVFELFPDLSRLRVCFLN